MSPLITRSYGDTSCALEAERRSGYAGIGIGYHRLGANAYNEATFVT